MCAAARRRTQPGARAGSTRRMPSLPPHPTHPPARPRAPCRRQAGAGAACGEGAQDRRRGAARFDAVTLRARRDATGPRVFALRGRPSCVQPRCRSSLGTRPLVARRGQAVRHTRAHGALCVPGLRAGPMALVSVKGSEAGFQSRLTPATCCLGVCGCVAQRQSPRSPVRTLTSSRTEHGSA